MKNIQAIIKGLTKFNNERLAIQYTYNTIKPTVVMLGDDNKYWICTLKEASILSKAGYKTIT